MDEPRADLKAELGRTGLTFFVDTNVIGERSEAVAQLYRCRAEGWIRIQRMDVLDTELMKGSMDAQQQFLEESSRLAEALGPFVVGHSRLGSSVIGGPEDVERLNGVFDLLHPSLNMRDAKENHVRDAMHVAGAARYGASLFVTRDKGILKKRERLQEALGIRVANPDDALVMVRNAIRAIIIARARGAAIGWLPKWVPPDH